VLHSGHLEGIIDGIFVLVPVSELVKSSNLRHFSLKFANSVVYFLFFIIVIRRGRRRRRRDWLGIHKRWGLHSLYLVEDREQKAMLWIKHI
jgi:hypothetical protein